MLTVRTPIVDKPDVAKIKADCKRLRITQDAVARAAGVTRPLVVNVFAGRDASRNVVEAALGLIAKAEKRASRRRGAAA